MPAGSVFSSFTLWLTTVRSPPPERLSVSAPPKSVAQTTAGASTATAAIRDRHTAASPSRTGTPRPVQGSSVWKRLPALTPAFGTHACSAIAAAQTTAAAASSRVAGPEGAVGPGPVPGTGVASVGGAAASGGLSTAQVS